MQQPALSPPPSLMTPSPTGSRPPGCSIGGNKGPASLSLRQVFPPLPFSPTSLLGNRCWHTPPVACASLRAALLPSTLPLRLRLSVLLSCLQQPALSPPPSSMTSSPTGSRPPGFSSSMIFPSSRRSGGEAARDSGDGGYGATDEEEATFRWEAFERLSTFNRFRREFLGGDDGGYEEVGLTSMAFGEQSAVLDKRRQRNLL